MVSTHVDIENTPWTAGTPFYGASAIFAGKDIVQLKILSDQRPPIGRRRHCMARQILSATRKADQNRRHGTFGRARVQSRRRPRHKKRATCTLLRRLHAQSQRSAAQRSYRD